VDAARRWREHLAALAIPPEILAAAPESPYGFSVEVFGRIADDAMAQPPDVAARRAVEALADAPTGAGEVLDVGCGAGAASLPLANRVRRLIGVDESQSLLAEFASRATRLDVPFTATLGRWPDVADQVPAVDVVVCRHVIYNVPDIDRFVERLTDHARCRVVVHLTAEHPLAWMIPYWRRLHGLDRPTGPTVEDFVDVLRELGLEATVDRWSEDFDMAGAHEDHRVAFLRRRLCASEARDDELRDALAVFGVPAERSVATVWWSPG
jgi:SAM-dependent methyltransferase